MAKKIGDVLREARVKAGLSVEQISDLLTQKGYKASTKTIYSWENGNSNPGPDTLLEMCTIYRIDDVLNTFGYNGYKEDGSLQLNLKEIEHIENYRSLDSQGQTHVDSVLNWESARVAELQKYKDRIAELEAGSAAIIELPSRFDARHLAEYFHDASAGSGIFILGNESDDKIAISESDWDDRIDYIIRVNGKSMEPDYMDGDNVKVSQRIEMKHGDVGIFVVDGKAYIKEYGETELISRNPSSPNIPIHEYDNIVCMGKVLGKLEGEYKIITD